MAKTSPTRRELLKKLGEVYWRGRSPGPSAYLSALAEEGTLSEIKAEIARLEAKTDA